MTTSGKPRTDRRRKCVCDWPPPRKVGEYVERCNGAGVIACEGCGGDQCVCVCGGTRDCEGCDACEPTRAMLEP